MVLLKYKNTNPNVPNPYSEIPIKNFGKLSMFETIGSKIHHDNEYETKTRKRFELAQAEINNDKVTDPDPTNTNPWQFDNTKKRGYKSPLSNDDKRNKTSPNEMNSIISTLLSNKETDNDDDSEDEEGKMPEAASLPI